MRLVKLKVKQGKEVMAELTRQLKKAKIKEASIVSLIGAVDGCCISNMPKDDAKADNLREYKEPFEFSGTGEVVDGKVHIHCVLSREGDQALGGHLHWAKVKTWFVSAQVLVK